MEGTSRACASHVCRENLGPWPSPSPSRSRFPGRAAGPRLLRAASHRSRHADCLQPRVALALLAGPAPTVRGRLAPPQPQFRRGPPPAWGLGPVSGGGPEEEMGFPPAPPTLRHVLLVLEVPLLLSLQGHSGRRGMAVASGRSAQGRIGWPLAPGVRVEVGSGPGR